MSSIDRPTSFDIAARAGVSQPTVSRALRNDPTISQHTRARIAAIARDMHYAVDKRASSLRRGRSNTLALLFFEEPFADGSLINPFFLSMLGSILRACATRGYDLLTSFQDLSADWHVDFEDSHKADGLILLGYGDYDLYRPRLQQLVAQGTHFVRWGSAAPDAIGTTIGCDNFAGGRAAGERLLGSGHRRIAFLGDASSRCPEFRDRYRGMLSAGVAADPALQVDALSLEPSGYAAVQRLLASQVAFDAVFAASDLIAIGAMRALRSAGLGVPDDVAVIGFDDIPAAGISAPPLTTIAQDVRHAGELLVDALIVTIQGRSTGTRLLTPSLVVRESG